MRPEYDIRRPVIESSTAPYYIKRLFILALIVAASWWTWNHIADIHDAVYGAAGPAETRKKTHVQREARDLEREERKGRP